MSKINQKEIAEEWAARGFSCSLWVDPPGRRWEDFSHARDEIVLVLEGEMEFEIEGKVYHPRIGQELIIPARAVHAARNIGSTTARWLYGYKRD
jgi:quercetin dioxygenase-like cupin family protein